MKGNKYFFKNCFEKFQNHFSNFETPSLAVSKFRKKLLKNSKTPRKKNRFQIQQKYFFRFQSSKRFLLFSSHFPAVFSMKTNFFLFSPNFSSVLNVSKDFFRFPANFSMKTKKLSFSPKFCFQNLIVFKCFKTIFSVFQPFYEIPKRLQKQFCSRLKIQNAYQNAQTKIKPPTKSIVFKNAALHYKWINICSNFLNL